MKTLDLDTEDKEQEEPKKPKANIPAKILTSLRKLVSFPDNPVKVEAINVYSTRWRVNVWTLGDNNARVESSWFVTATDKGDIVSFN
jgi:hypothetical protein